MSDASVIKAIENNLENDAFGQPTIPAKDFHIFDAPRDVSVIRFFSEVEMEPGLVLDAFGTGFDGVLLGASNGLAPEQKPYHKGPRLVLGRVIPRRSPNPVRERGDQDP